jgi:hypothetical protein
MIFENASKYNDYMREDSYSKKHTHALPSFQGDMFFEMDEGSEGKDTAVRALFGRSYRYDKTTHIEDFIKYVEGYMETHPGHEFLIPVRVQVTAKPGRTYRDLPLDAGLPTVKNIAAEFRKFAVNVRYPQNGELTDHWDRRGTFRYLMWVVFPRSFSEFFGLNITDKEVVTKFNKPICMLSKSPSSIIIGEILATKFPALYRKTTQKSTSILMPTFITNTDVECVEKVLNETSENNRAALFSLFLNNEEEIKRAEKTSITTCGLISSSAGLGSVNTIKRCINDAIARIESFRKVLVGLEKIEEMCKSEKKKLIFTKALAKYADEHYMDYEHSTTKFWEAVRGIKHGRVEDFDIEEEAEESEPEEVHEA